MTHERWAAPRQRIIYAVNVMARRGVRDVMRETRQELRAARVPVDPWVDATIAGRSGNASADFMCRVAHVLHIAGRTPAQIREKLVLLAHRVADAVHSAKPHRSTW